MRRFHRWLSLPFAVLLLFIAVTGVLSQVGSLVNDGLKDETRAKGAAQAAAIGAALVAPANAHDGENHAEGVAPAAAAPAKAAATSSAAAPFVCPETMTCRPRKVARPGEWDVGYLHHLHSGEEFGPVGVAVSILSGLALIFFAFSGLFMYLQMFRARAGKRGEGRGGKFFW